MQITSNIKNTSEGEWQNCQMNFASNSDYKPKLVLVSFVHPADDAKDRPFLTPVDSNSPNEDWDILIEYVQKTTYQWQDIDDFFRQRETKIHKLIDSVHSKLNEAADRVAQAEDRARAAETQAKALIDEAEQRACHAEAVARCALAWLERLQQAGDGKPNSVAEAII